MFVRCSSEFPFFPGGQAVARFDRERRFGAPIEVRALFLHSSDLDPEKPINWKRIADLNGEYGCMGDLGMHALHLPLRVGWEPINVRAILSEHRPRAARRPRRRAVACDTWDNAMLLCEVEPRPHVPDARRDQAHRARRDEHLDDRDRRHRRFDRVHDQVPEDAAPNGVRPGGAQAWQTIDLGSTRPTRRSPAPIFEFGFSDAILQMWAAFCDELAHGRDGMRQPFYCATPEEAAATHRLFTAALESQRNRAVVAV